MRLSEIAGRLGAAYSMTNDQEYAEALIEHCKAWFVNEETVINPHLSYAQAIKGKVSGRGIGIIDTIHLIEVALAIRACKSSISWPSDDYNKIITWFENYINWLTTDDFGIQEMLNGNNHSTTWALQVAAYSYLVENDSLTNAMDSLYKNYLLPTQMAPNGSFPLELKRTKPFAYSLFNLDAMASLCQILKLSGKEGLFEYKGSDKQSMSIAASWMYPMLEDKTSWAYVQDTQYWEALPWKSAGMLFIGLEYDIDAYTALWNTANTKSEIYEIRRNTYVRNPVLWLQSL